MQRSMKATVLGSMALVALLAGAGARAADPAPAATGATVTVKVVDAEGKPSAGTKVSIVAAVKRAKRGADAPASQPAADKPVPMTATTDADGTATITGVADGSYNVRAMTKGFRARGKVVVAEGKAEPVSLTLAAPAAK